MWNRVEARDPWEGPPRPSPDAWIREYPGASEREIQRRGMESSRVTEEAEGGPKQKKRKEEDEEEPAKKTMYKEEQGKDTEGEKRQKIDAKMSAEEIDSALTGETDEKVEYTGADEAAERAPQTSTPITWKD